MYLELRKNILGKATNRTCPWKSSVALVLTLPIIAVITAFVWYLNLGGVLSKMKKAGKASRSVNRTDRLETEEA